MGRYSAQLVLDGAGDGLVEFNPVPLGEQHYIERIAIHTSGAVAPTVDVFVNSASAFNLMDRSTGLEINIADEASPIVLESGEKLILRWDGAAAGATATAVIQVREVTAPEPGEESTAEPGVVENRGYGGDGLIPAW